jgi:regulator of RNase E activity RraA
MKLLYALAALVVLLAFLEIVDTVVADKSEMEAVGGFKAYVETARAAGMTGNQPPDVEVAIPMGYSIVVSGDYVELHDDEGVVMRESWRQG